MSGALQNLEPAFDLRESFSDLSQDTNVEANLAPADLLIVDDDDAALERLSAIAESAGYTVRTARHGLEALNILATRATTLVLADAIMPKMSGVALCEAIRSAAFPSYVYTIMLSARDGAEDVVAALSAGADDFVSKRAGRSELLARLHAGRRIAGLDLALRKTIAENLKLCHVDGMTDSFTTRYLMLTLAQEIERSRQHAHWVSVLMCNIDRFRRVNDDHGHAVGDEVLRQVVTRIRATTEEKAAWVARYGGDTFVVVLPETPIERASVAAEVIRNSVATNPIVCSAGRVPLTLSIGVCGVGPTELRTEISAARLLDAAGDCLRTSKGAGRNTVTARAYLPGSKLITPLKARRRGG